MKTTHQNNQATAYNGGAIQFEDCHAHKDRTYGLKVKFAKSIITAKGLATGTLFEVGCGTGLFTQKLAEAMPQLNIVATDAYQPMLDIAQKKLKDYKNVRCEVYDAEFTPPPMYHSENHINTMVADIFCGVDIIHHIEKPVEALREWRAMTKTNGVLLFLECNPANPVMYIRNYNRIEERRFYLNNKKNLTSWVEAAGWKNVIVKNMPTYLPSGPKKMWNMLTATEEFIHKIPLINRLSAMFLVYAENHIN